MRLKTSQLTHSVSYSFMHEFKCNKRIRRFPSVTFISCKGHLFVCGSLTEDFCEAFIRERTNSLIPDAQVFYWIYCQDWALTFRLSQWICYENLIQQTSQEIICVLISFLDSLKQTLERKKYLTKGTAIQYNISVIFTSKRFICCTFLAEQGYDSDLGTTISTYLMFSRCSGDNCMDCYVISLTNTQNIINKRHARIQYNIKTNTFQSNL